MEYFNGNQAEENSSYEFNAPYDYIAELRAEHYDHCAGDEEYTMQDHIDAAKREGWTDAEIAEYIAAMNEPVETDADGDLPF